mgnify:CR=1 FL=1
MSTFSNLLENCLIHVFANPSDTSSSSTPLTSPLNSPREKRIEIRQISRLEEIKDKFYNNINKKIDASLVLLIGFLIVT